MGRSFLGEQKGVGRPLHSPWASAPTTLKLKFPPWKTVRKNSLPGASRWPFYPPIRRSPFQPLSSGHVFTIKNKRSPAEWPVLRPFVCEIYFWGGPRKGIETDISRISSHVSSVRKLLHHQLVYQKLASFLGVAKNVCYGFITVKLFPRHPNTYLNRCLNPQTLNISWASAFRCCKHRSLPDICRILNV